jgi:hypothetical protein
LEKRKSKSFPDDIQKQVNCRSNIREKGFMLIFWPHKQGLPDDLELRKVILMKRKFSPWLLVIYLCLVGILTGIIPGSGRHNSVIGVTSASAADGELKWKYQIENKIAAPPAIAPDGTIYLVDENAFLYAIKNDGTLKYVIPTGGTGCHFSPGIATDGTIYISISVSGTVTGDSGHYYLRAFYPDGSFKWSLETVGASHSSPAIALEGTIYVSGDGCLYAVYPNGTLKWKYIVGVSFASAPAIGLDGTIYVGADNSLYAIKPDGTKKWSYSIGNEVQSSPAIGWDGTIYVGSNSPYLYALNPNGTLKWKYATGGSWVFSSSPVIGNYGYIFVASWDNYLYALRPDGTLRWKFKTFWTLMGASPAIGADGTIYVGSFRLHAIKPNGSQKWDYQIYNQMDSSKIYAPAINPDGTVYYASPGDTILYAISTSSGGLMTSSAWPMLYHDLKHTGRVINSLKPPIEKETRLLPQLYLLLQ